MSNLVNEVAETVGDHPEETAMVAGDTALSYEAFWGRTGQFAAALQDHGVAPGDAVAVYLPNLPQFVTAFHGTLRAGGVVVPMNPQYKSREISHLLADSGAEVVVALADLVPFVQQAREETAVEHVVTVGGEADAGTDFEAFLAEETADVVDRADDDLAVQPYTSGTTGQPKGVQLTHHNLTWNTNATTGLIPDGIGPDDRQLGVLPLFHIYGMTVVMNTSLFTGATYYPVPQWDAEQAAGIIEREEITLMHGVPAMYNDLINQPDVESFDLSSLRLATSGGSGLPVEVLRTFEDLFGVTLYEGYGLTETAPVTHFNSAVYGRRVGSIGKPLEGLDVRVVDEEFEPVPPVEEGPVDEDEVDLDEITGEIVVAGPTVMKGYAGLPEANEEAFTEADGRRWFHTGDVGYYDADDYYYVVDRAKHVIVTGGYNVYPREVEEFLFEHPGVADVAIVGVPDERRGETVHAFVVPTPDADVTPEEIKEHCLANMAEYKHPREVHFVEELPRTTTGKVQKFELVEDAGGDAAGAGAE